MLDMNEFMSNIQSSKCWSESLSRCDVTVHWFLFSFFEFRANFILEQRSRLIETNLSTLMTISIKKTDINFLYARAIKGYLKFENINNTTPIIKTMVIVNNNVTVTVLINVCSRFC